MVVLPYSSLPLAVNLKWFAGVSGCPRDVGSGSGQFGLLAEPATAGSVDPVFSSQEEYRDYLRYLDTVVNSDSRHDGRIPDLDGLGLGLVDREDRDVDYKFMNLWGSNLTLDGKPIKFVHLPPFQKLEFLRNHTYWYKRLKFANRRLVDILCQTHAGTLRLKEVLHCSDAMVISLLLGFPELVHQFSRVYYLTDMIHNQVISNCLANYAAFSNQVKAARKAIRHAVLANEPLTKDLLGRNCISSFSGAIDALNKIKDQSRRKLYKTLCITQSRAWGLPDSKMEKQQIQQFIAEVTVRKDFNPNDDMLGAIDAVTSRIVQNASLPGSAMTKISISTRSCLESSVRKEGKFGYLRRLIKDWDLSEDQLRLKFGGEPGTVADPVWNEALIRAIEKHPDMNKVNVAAIRENAKVRVVTSGSFFKDALLQPFSHLTIELMKCEPSIRDSVRAARHGYRFLERVQNDPIFPLYEGKWRYYCTDFERATDAPPQASGRAVMRPLLSKIGVPDLVIEAMLHVWVGDKQLYVNGKHIGTQVNGIPMGDPLTKTNLSLAHPICIEYARRRCLKNGDDPGSCIAAGNGDDFAMLYTTEPFRLYLKEGYAMLGYKESPKDTFTSDIWGFYCEEALLMPRPMMTEKISRRLNRIDLLPYLDYPRVRLLIDTTKDREDFSSRPEGKIGLLGKEMSYFPAGSIQYEYYQFASMLQDVSLGTLNSKVPWAVPRHFWGVGKPPIYHKVDNYKRLVDQLPHWQRRLILAVVYEIQTGEYNLLRKRGALRAGERHFDKEAVFEWMQIPEDDLLNEHVYLTVEQQSKLAPGVVSNFVEYGHLIPESKVAAIYLFNKRLVSLTQKSEEHDLMQYFRDESIREDCPIADEEMLVSFMERWARGESTFRGVFEQRLWDRRTIAALMESDPIFLSQFPFPLPLINEFKDKRERVPTIHEERVQNMFLEFDAYKDHYRNGTEFIPSDWTVIPDDHVVMSTIRETNYIGYYVVTQDWKLIESLRLQFLDKIILQVPVGDLLRSHNWIKEAVKKGKRKLDKITASPEMPDPIQYGKEYLQSLHPHALFLVDTGSVDTFLPQRTSASMREVLWGQDLHSAPVHTGLTTELPDPQRGRGGRFQPEVHVPNEYFQFLLSRKYNQREFVAFQNARKAGFGFDYF